MVIRIIAPGKLKENYLKEAYSEYEKRLGAFCRLETVQLPVHRLPENPSPALIEAALEAEAQQILSALPAVSLTAAMCIEGKKLDSEAFAGIINDAAVSGMSTAVFIIGSSYGLSERVKKACDLRLSMSDMTFPHQLSRIMLAEQLYRAFTIINNRKYHK